MEIRCIGTTQTKCNAYLGHKEPLEDTRVSHGLCKACEVETYFLIEEFLTEYNGRNNSYETK